MKTVEIQVPDNMPGDEPWTWNVPEAQAFVVSRSLYRSLSERSQQIPALEAQIADLHWQIRRQQFRQMPTILRDREPGAAIGGYRWERLPRRRSGAW